MKRGWYFIIFIGLISCEKNIDFKLQESSPTLVVDAVIENDQAPRVVLTQSVSYYSEISLDVLEASFIHQAEVSVSNGEKTHRLKEIAVPIAFGYSTYYYGIDSNSLSTAFVGELNKLYTLTLNYNGKVFTATTKIPSIDVKPDSVFSKPVPFSEDTNNRIVYIKATDPPGLGNYLRIFTKKNSEPFYTSSNSVFPDQVVDGTTYTFQLEPGFDRNSIPSKDEQFFKKNDTLTLKICNIDKATYTFWNTWEFAFQAIGNPFSQPNKIIGNISNGGLGAFCGYGAWYRTLIIK